MTTTMMMMITILIGLTSLTSHLLKPITMIRLKAVICKSERDVETGFCCNITNYTFTYYRILFQQHGYNTQPWCLYGLIVWGLNSNESKPSILWAIIGTIFSNSFRKFATVFIPRTQNINTNINIFLQNCLFDTHQHVKMPHTNEYSQRWY